MASLLHSSSIVVSRQQGAATDDSHEPSPLNTPSGSIYRQEVEAPSTHTKPTGAQELATLEAKVNERLPPPEARRISSVDSYAESQSTAPSSCVDDSSGRNSPVSTSTATTSNFYFDFEDQLELAVGDDDASELRSYSSPLHMCLRGRPSLSRAASLDATKQPDAEGTLSPDKDSISKHLGGSREASPPRSSYTFPFRSAHGWSTPNSPTHPTSAPGSAPESRRDSAQIGLSSRPKSRLGTLEPMYGEYGVGPTCEPERLSGDAASGTPMDDSDNPAEEEVNVSFPSVQPSRTPGAWDVPDCMSQSVTSPLQRPGQKQTEDISELILRQAFNVSLQDLATASDALESVAHCLEELQHVVYGCRSLEFRAPLREAPSGDSATSSRKYENNTNSQTDRGKKRPSSRGNQDEEGPSGHERDGDRNGGNENPLAKSKKIKVDPPENRYACPFRKRNPLKFNIRDHTTCATTHFSAFADLKRHIKLYHRCQARLPYVCFRCGVDQETRDQLMSHLQLPPEDICVVRHEAHDNDPEDGITQQVKELLNERKSSAKIDTWPSLWKALFGSDDEILAPEFEPPVELDEVRNEFEATLDELKNRVQLETKAIEELSPEAQVYVANHMEFACWDYINSVLSASRLRVDFSPEKQHHNKRRRSQRSAANHSPSGHVLLSPIMQRQILPKPLHMIAEDGRPIASKVVSVSSTGSSLSSSWETAISNRSSSSKLQSTSSSTSLTTPGGEPLLPTSQHGLFISTSATGFPALDAYLVQNMPGNNAACGSDKGKAVGRDPRLDLADYDALTMDQFPAYVDASEVEAFTLRDGLDGLFGYEGDFNECGGSGDIYDGVISAYDVRDATDSHDAPLDP